MNIQKIFTGTIFNSPKKIQKFLTKFVFSLLISAFFVGGVAPLVSIFSENPEISENFGVERAYAEINEAKYNELMSQADSTLSATDRQDMEDYKSNNSESTWSKDLKNGDMSKNLKKQISEFAALMISIFTPIIAILVKLIETLMDDSYTMGTNGPDAGLPIAQVLYELWIVFRDIMNYLFILILLFFAFMNVIAPIADNDNFALKTILPKMIMAIVVINMTWFGARVVFDVVDVSARVVFGLPQAIMQGAHGEALDPSRNPCIVGTSSTTNKFVGIQGLCDAAYVNLNSPAKSCESKKIDGKSYKTKNCAMFTLDKKASGCEESSEYTGYYSPQCFPLSVTDVDGGEKALDALLAIKKSEQTNACTADAQKKDSSTCKDLKASAKKIEKIIAEGGLKKAVNYGPVTVYWRDFKYERFNQGTIAPMFAFSILQIQNLPRIADTNYQKLTNEGAGWSTLVINILISLIIMIILIVLFALMVINLFFRVIVLWINIIFSPFYGLLIFKEQLNIDGAESEYLGLAAFIKHAFAPVIMGLPLVIGFIMITVGKQYGTIPEGGGMGIDTPMIDNVSNIHQLFYYVLAIVVLWVGGIKAIEATSSEFVNSTFISPIKEGVTSAAKFVATAPMYINFIPVAGKDGEMGSLNLSHLRDISDGFQSNRRRQSQQELSDLGLNGDGQGFLDKHELLIKRLDKGDKSGVKKGLENLITGKTMNDSINEVNSAHKKDFNEILKSADTIGKMEKLLTHYGVENATTDQIKTVIKTVSGKKAHNKNPENSDAPKKVSERKVAEVISESQKYLNKSSSSTLDEKKEYTVAIINKIGINADKYDSDADKDKYVKAMIKDLKEKVSGKTDNATIEIHAMIDEIAKKDIKKISTITTSEAEKLIPDDKKSS